NRSDLDQRRYTMAETYGHAYLDHLEKHSVLHLESDDAQSIVLYLQHIGRVRPDVIVVGTVIVPFGPTASQGEPVHYYERPEENVFWSSSYRQHPRWPWGPLWRTPRPEESAVAWKEPLAAEHIPRFFRRTRGQFVDRSNPFKTVVRPEPYEMRLLRLLLLARKNQADADAAAGNLVPAVQRYESILALDPTLEEVLYPLAVIYVGLQRYTEAEATFKKALELDLLPTKRAEVYYFLAALCGERPEAAEWKAKALSSRSLAPELRAKLEGR
ncbi:MAG: tetratricopeptide repeat protein, partial [Planctomycetota bacterium]